MPNLMYPICALLGHDWVFMRKSKNYLHYECEVCDRRRKDPR